MVQIGNRLGAILAATAFINFSASAQTVADAKNSATNGPILQLDAITVNATKTDRLAIDSPESISVIDLNEIEARIPNSLGDLLEDIPGVELDGGPRGLDEQPSIRGLGGNRVLIRVDGARKSFDAGHRGRAFVDPALLRQVDVIRGPASTIHGAGALGGVVAFETKRASDFLEDGDRFGFRIKQGYLRNSIGWLQSYTAFGQYQDDIDAIASLSFKKTKDVSLSDDVTRQSINGVIRDRGSLPNSAEDLNSALLKTTITAFEDQTITLSYNRFRNDARAFTTPDVTFNSTTVDVDRLTTEDTVSLKYEYANPDNDWLNPTVNLYLSNTEVDENRIGNPRREDRDTLTVGLDAFNETYASFGESIDTTFLYGIEVFQDQQEGAENGVPDPNFPNSTGNHTSAYFQAENDIGDRWTVTAGARLDHFHLELDDNTLGQEDFSISPKLGVTYRPIHWLSVHGLYAEAFRAPSLTELFVSGVHFAVPPFVTNVFVPNPNLEPEKGRSFETGLGVSFDDLAMEGDGLRGKVTAFRTYYDDFIEQTVNATTTVTDNVPDAHISGFELEAEYATRMPFIRVGYHQYRGKNDTQDISLNNIPADTVFVDLGSRFPSLGLTAGTRIEMAEEQNRFGNENRSAGYTVIDLYSTWAPGKVLFDGALDGFRLDAGVDNLLDKNYQRHLSNLPEEGVNYKISVAYKLTF